MSIDIRNISGPQGSGSGAGAGAGSVSQDGTTGPAQSAPSRDGGRSGSADQVALSETAQRLKGLAESARSASEVDTARVERIRAQIAEGRYHVDPAKLAGRMLDLERDLLG